MKKERRAGDQPVWIVTMGEREGRVRDEDDDKPRDTLVDLFV
jgi:hypothetical protein